MEAKQFFKENGYVVIRGFLDKNLCILLYHHIQNEALRLGYLLENYEHKDFNEGINDHIHGKFDDIQAPNDFSKYGDPIFDSILDLKTKEMSELTGMDLVPNYTYHRLYTTNTELKRHKDRASCEISTTICIGYNADYNWPMFVGPKDGEKGTEGNPIHLEPGDMIIYRGYDIEHWREPFKGINHAQLFMHYNRTDGPFEYNEETDKFDGRPILGLTPSHRNLSSKEIRFKKSKAKELKKTSKVID
jgi:hypothetical protein